MQIIVYNYYIRQHQPQPINIYFQIEKEINNRNHFVHLDFYIKYDFKFFKIVDKEIKHLIKKSKRMNYCIIHGLHNLFGLGIY